MRNKTDTRHPIVYLRTTPLLNPEYLFIITLCSVFNSRIYCRLRYLVENQPSVRKLVHAVSRRLRSWPAKIRARVVSEKGSTRPGQTPDVLGTCASQSRGLEIQDIIRLMHQRGIKAEGEKNSIPIIFMHYTNSYYLKYSLAQAKLSNPHSPVYLLGDASNNCYPFVKHQDFSDYFQAASEFSRFYTHFSTNRYHYSLFDFQRWFILKEFLTANNIERCLYLDSDTMLYADVTEEQKKFAKYDFTLSAMICGQTFFLNRIKALEDFCDFLFNIYTKRDRYHYDKMVAHYAVCRKNGVPGGASDMKAFSLYLHNRHYAEIGEVSEIIDGSIFDINITTPTPGFEMEKGIKKVIWQDGLPYGRRLQTGELIRFNSLHFQGGNSKKLMGQYFTYTQTEV